MKLNCLFFFLLCAGLRLTAQVSELNQIYLADPTIFKDEDGYYLYGTKQDSDINGEGFLVYYSRDNEHWEGPVGAKDGFALKKGDSFGEKGFWAPQVFKHHSKYYMAYTANENIAVATSDSPLGPFTNNMKSLNAKVKQIDPFVFFDNGKAYLYHVRLQDGNRVFVSEMSKDLQNIKPETLKECLHAEAEWENTKNSKWPVSEGPSVFKNNGIYYLLYSANDFRNPDYAVGYATSSSPLGPWKKSSSNPIISSSVTGHAGTGHGDIYKDDHGNLNYVLHTHFSENSVHPRKTAVIKLKLEGDRLKAESETFKYVKINSTESRKNGGFEK